MATDDILHYLEREERRLSDELAATPVYRKLQQIQKLIALYRTEEDVSGTVISAFMDQPPPRRDGRSVSSAT